MPLFRYLALTPNGKRSVGTINAESIELAKENLRKERILVAKIALYKTKASRLRLPSRQLLDLTRGMAMLLKAGLPLYDTLKILKEKHRQSKLHTLFLDLAEQIKDGSHLSVALAKYPKAFSPIYLSMVRAGEESGTLANSFSNLFNLIEKDQKLKKKILSALMYPLFLAFFCLAILILLFFFLIPSMRELLEGQALHPITQSVLSISDMLETHGKAIFFSLSSFLITSLFVFRTKKGKRCLYKTLYAFPIVKRVMTENLFARFCRVFSLLLRSQISLIESLNLAKQVMKQPIFEEEITQTEAKVISGDKLSEALQKSEIVPTLVTRMIALGEESGNLGEMMEHVTAIYEEDVERSLLKLTTFLQPAMLLVMGIIVATILLAVMLPLTDMSSFS